MGYHELVLRTRSISFGPVWASSSLAWASLWNRTMQCWPLGQQTWKGSVVLWWPFFDVFFVFKDWLSWLNRRPSWALKKHEKGDWWRLLCGSNVSRSLLGSVFLGSLGSFAWPKHTLACREAKSFYGLDEVCSCCPCWPPVKLAPSTPMRPTKADRIWKRQAKTSKTKLTNKTRTHQVKTTELTELKKKTQAKQNNPKTFIQSGKKRTTGQQLPEHADIDVFAVMTSLPNFFTSHPEGDTGELARFSFPGCSQLVPLDGHPDQEGGHALEQMLSLRSFCQCFWLLSKSLPWTVIYSGVNWIDTSLSKAEKGHLFSFGKKEWGNLSWASENLFHWVKMCLRLMLLISKQKSLLSLLDPMWYWDMTNPLKEQQSEPQCCWGKEEQEKSSGAREQVWDPNLAAGWVGCIKLTGSCTHRPSVGPFGLLFIVGICELKPTIGKSLASATAKDHKSWVNQVKCICWLACMFACLGGHSVAWFAWLIGG